MHHVFQISRIFVQFLCAYVAVLVLWCGCSRSYRTTEGQDTSRQVYEPSPTPSLDVDDKKVIEAISCLRDRPSTPDNNDAQAVAAEFLGKRRSLNAIPVLADKTIKITSRNYFGMDPAKSYPAYAALLNIGEPAVPAICKQLETTVGGDQLTLVDLLRKIKGNVWTARYLSDIQRAGMVSKTHNSYKRLEDYVNSYK